MLKWVSAALAAVSVLALGSVAVAQQQTAGQAAPTVRGARPDVIAEGAREVSATMRDGVKLAGNLYLPAGKGPFACIVTRTPYGKDEMYKDPRGAEGYTKAG